MGDPDHLNSFQIIRLYNHWLNRQKKGLPPFEVLNAGPLHQHLGKKSKKSDKGKGKEKKRYVEFDEDNENEDDSNKVNDDEENDDGEVDDNDDDDVSMEEDDGGASERDRRKPGPSVVKFGPPVGNGRRNIPSARRDQQSPPLAGPSKLPPLKQSLEKSAVRIRHPEVIKCSFRFTVELTSP